MKVPYGIFYFEVHVLPVGLLSDVYKLYELVIDDNYEQVLKAVGTPLQEEIVVAFDLPRVFRVQWQSHRVKRRVQRQK